MTVIDLNDARPAGREPQDTEYVRRLKERMAGRARSILEYLLPGGRIMGGEFKCGDIQGNRGDSLSISLSAHKLGVGQDFATGEVFGDLIDVWMQARRLDFKSACDEIEAWLGNPRLRDRPPAIKTEPAKQLGAPTGTWRYLDNDGSPIAVHYRYDLEDGSKEFRPWDVRRQKATFPEPRPLYAKPDIAAADKVVVVEGEKCADAINRLDGLQGTGIAATTAMGGAQSPESCDWSPLKGKHVLIWRDNDAPGVVYAAAADRLARAAGALSVAHLPIPDGKDEGWDVADAVREGLPVAAMIVDAFAERPVPLPAQTDEPEPVAASLLQGDPPPREWIWTDWLPARTVTLFSGDGGVGKTLLAQQLGTSIATGRPFMGNEVRSLPVLGVFCEDDLDELHRRQVAINAAMGVAGAPELARFRLWSRVGYANTLAQFDQSGRCTLTPFYQRVEAQLAAIGEPALLMLDTVADIYAGNENVRPQVNHFVKAVLGAWSLKYGTTILILAHPSVSGMNSGSGLSGSTAWNGAVRSRLYLTKADENEPDERILTRKKANYARSGDNEKIDLIWKNGTLQPSRDETYWLERRNQENLILNEIASAWDNKAPLGVPGRRGERPIDDALGRRFSLPHRTIIDIVQKLTLNGTITLDRQSDGDRKRGYRVVRTTPSNPETDS